MTEARIILDSISPANHRLTTFVVTFNRFILAEWNTHRCLSRNAASSRAIPVKKMLAAVKENPAMPVWWGKNEAGMQANAELDDTVRDVAIPYLDDLQEPRTPATALSAARIRWIEARDWAIRYTEDLIRIGLHKQIANRLLEPWSHVTVLVTATDWDNFFALRAHPDAQPEFRELAFKMLECYNISRPTPRDYKEWHIPFGDQMPAGLTLDTQLKVATARAARLSYLTFEGEIDVVKDCELHDRLLASGHLSPFEHCAYAALAGETQAGGNLRGWTQYRKLHANENKTDSRVRKWTYQELRAKN